MRIVCNSESPKDIEVYDNDGNDVTSKLNLLAIDIHMDTMNLTTATFTCNVDRIDIVVNNKEIETICRDEVKS